MPDNVTNELIYQTLVKMQGDITAMHTDLKDIKHRANHLESLAGEHLLQLGHLVGKDAKLQEDIDALGERVLRIERRLELSEGTL